MSLSLKTESVCVLSAVELASARGGQAKARVLKPDEVCDSEAQVVGRRGLFGEGRQVVICTSAGFGDLAAKYMR